MTDDDWSTKHLKEYVERVLAERDKSVGERNKRLDERFAASEKAIGVALLSIEAHLKILNEYRGTLTDQGATFALREAVELQVGDLQKQLSALHSSLAEARVEAATVKGKGTGYHQSWLYVIGALAAGAAAVGIINFVIGFYQNAGMPPS